jgi:hypothetical protein
VAKTALKVDLTGPLFTRDVRKTVGQNIRRMLDGLADEGDRIVTGATPVLTGSMAHGIRRTRVRMPKDGLYTVTIYASHVYPWPNGGSKEYRGGKAERRYGMFRRAKNALNRSRAVLAANLVEGLE